ncbi:MAG: AMIN domain-containing protein [bacterium]|nr:AMIN domain-containing protein [bacterium]
MKKLFFIITLPIIIIAGLNGATVDKVKFQDDASEAKIVIFTDAYNYKTISLHNPERIVIDFENATSKLRAKEEFNLVDFPLVSVRSSQYKPLPTPVTRVVIDLSRPIEYLTTYEENRLEIKFAKSPSASTPNVSTPNIPEEEAVNIPSEVPITTMKNELTDSIPIVNEADTDTIVMKDTTAPKKETFFYNSRGKRDPFRPWLGVEGHSDSLLDVSVAIIVGIMWSPNSRYALAQDPNGKGYILSEGDKVWNGKVEKIEKDNVVFALHGFGGVKRITLKLLPKEERSDKEEK